MGEGRVLRRSRGISVAYHGNIVDLLGIRRRRTTIHIDLLSDQTSCHNAYEGGYCPVALDV